MIFIRNLHLTVLSGVRYSRAKVCTARGKHSNKVTKKVYSFKICKAKGKVCKTIITYFSPLGLYGITKKIVISKKLKRWTKEKLLWTSHVTIIKPLKVSQQFGRLKNCMDIFIIHLYIEDFCPEYLQTFIV